MFQVVEVRLREGGRIAYHEIDDIKPKPGDLVIVEADRGLDYGEVLSDVEVILQKDLEEPLRKVKRIATKEDMAQIKKNREKIKDVFNICLRKIQERNIPMKLVEAEYSFDRTKVILYFTAEGRIDFRDLVKDLAHIFRVRIELKQRTLPFFSISAENFQSQIEKYLGSNDILTGDEHFDNRVLIEGSNSTIMHILLNNDARTIISNFINKAYRRNFQADENSITCAILTRHIQTKKDIRRILQDLGILVKIFSRQGSPANLLKENYISETNTNVKKKLLNALYFLTVFLVPDDPVITDALASSNYEIQFLGAKLLRKKGYDKIKLLYETGIEDIRNLIINYVKQEKIPVFRLKMSF